MPEAIHSGPGQDNPLAGLRVACGPAPRRGEVLAALAARTVQEDNKMNWLLRKLAGRPLGLRLAAWAAVGCALLALSLLLPFARGLRHAPQALASDGGFAVVVPLPAAAGEIAAPMQQAVAAWAQATNAQRRAQGERPLSVASEVVVDPRGQRVAQFMLAGASGAEAADLAGRLGGGGPAGLQVIAIAPGDGDALRAVKPLDDPANPYRGQYSALDRWIYEHAWSYADLTAFREQCARISAERPARPDDPDIRFMGALVEDTGWMRPTAVPVMAFGLSPIMPLAERDVWEREQQRALSAASAQGRPLSATQHLSWIFSGPGSDELYTEYLKRTRFSYVASIPRIPRWLAENPPLQATLLPGGEVVTYGKPGEQGVAPAPGSPWPLPTASGWYRYSADGTLLEQNTAWGADPFSWVNFYWPEAPAAACEPRNSGSYWVRLAPADPAEPAGAHDVPPPVAAYAYDGTPLALDAPVPPALLAGRVLQGAQLAELYAQQQEQGLWYADPAEQQPDSPGLPQATPAAP